MNSTVRKIKISRQAKAMETWKRISSASMIFLFLLLIMVTTIASSMQEELAAAASASEESNCQATCGDVSIPYPFGTGPGCYLNEYFKVVCNTTMDPPKPFLWGTTLEILSISIEGEIRVNTFIGTDCYTESGVRKQPLTAFAILPAFPFSTTRNKFTAVGCDTIAVIMGANGNGFSSGCLSLCSTNSSVSEGSCDGIGCCQTAIPKMLLNYNASVGSLQNHTKVWSFNPCSYAFIAEVDSFNFSKEDLNGMRNRTRVPSVLDWAIWNQTCDEGRMNASSFACKANSECTDFEDIPGYRCSCSSGYQGNPYSSNGCTDIDECANSKDNNCVKTCHNTPGNYTCSCPRGYHGDGRRDGEGCVADHSTVIKIVIGVGVGFLVLLFSGGFIYLGIKKRNLIKLKEEYFKQNGGFLLQQQLRERNSNRTTMKIFTAEELEKATDNFNESRIVGRGGYGTVYKGLLLPHNTVIAIKKSKFVDKSQIEQFINEVIVLSQINHRNVVKLLGCCLETEVPLLVYEFVSNGTLFDHIHNQGKALKMPWETRLRIAAETAGVLSYLHYAASIPIIHRDIKSTNILVDENYIAKVSDFGASRLVPLDQTQISTMVQGTLGYLDPEYLHTSTLTEKSDVYSFGVVLVELMTGRKAVSFDKPEEERSLVMYFMTSLKENRLFQIIEDFIANDANTEQLKEVADLAKRCLRIKGEERPTMKEVAMELEGMRTIGNHSWISVEVDSEETMNLLLETSPDSTSVYSGSVINTDARYDTMRNHGMPPVSNGR